jgi:thymidylate synthase (FAD)
MKEIAPSFECIFGIPDDILTKLELAGRTCWKSEGRIDQNSAPRFIKMLIDNNHLSVLEHISITVKIICDRALTHQLVRHRLGSYSQESQRYVKYNELEVIISESIKKNEDTYKIVKKQIEDIEKTYSTLLQYKIKPEDARAILPNATKTEIVVTYNLRQWRHVFTERCSKQAQSSIRSIMIQILKYFKEKIPVIFDDFKLSEDGSYII